MDQIATEGQSMWPDLALEVGVFRAYLAERAGTTAMPGDLFLACACLHDVPGAIAAFARTNRHVLDAAVRKADPSPAFADDVRQDVLELLFVPKDGRPPKIAQYSGRGPLGAWTYVTALRIARRLKVRAAGRGEKDERAVREGIYQELNRQTDPSMAGLKERYAPEVKEALYAAIDALPAQERFWFFMNVVEGISTGSLGKMSGVDQSTVHRHIANTKTALLTEVKRYLSKKLKLRDSECDSLVQLVQSQFDITLSRVFERLGEKKDGEKEDGEKKTKA